MITRLSAQKLSAYPKVYYPWGGLMNIREVQVGIRSNLNHHGAEVSVI